MNAERQELFFEMYYEAFDAAEAGDFRVVLDRSRFWKPAYDFIRGEDCSHTPVLCVRVQSNGRRMYFRYCTACGKKLTNFLPYKSLTPSQMQAARPHNDYDRLYDQKMKCSTKVGEFFTVYWWWAYDQYLQSDDWRALRAKVLARDRNRCRLQLEGCTETASQVHHLTYERVTHEQLEDLVSACDSCHKLHHTQSVIERVPSL